MSPPSSVTPTNVQITIQGDPVDLLIEDARRVQHDLSAPSRSKGTQKGKNSKYPYSTLDTGERPDRHRERPTLHVPTQWIDEDYHHHSGGHHSGTGGGIAKGVQGTVEVPYYQYASWRKVRGAVLGQEGSVQIACAPSYINGNGDAAGAYEDAVREEGTVWRDQSTGERLYVLSDGALRTPEDDRVLQSLCRVSENVQDWVLSDEIREALLGNITARLAQYQIPTDNAPTRLDFTCQITPGLLTKLGASIGLAGSSTSVRRRSSVKSIAHARGRFDSGVTARTRRIDTPRSARSSGVGGSDMMRVWVTLPDTRAA